MKTILQEHLEEQQEALMVNALKTLRIPPMTAARRVDYLIKLNRDMAEARVKWQKRHRRIDRIEIAAIVVSGLFAYAAAVYLCWRLHL